MMMICIFLYTCTWSEWVKLSDHKAQKNHSTHILSFSRTWTLMSVVCARDTRDWPEPEGDNMNKLKFVKYPTWWQWIKLLWLLRSHYFCSITLRSCHTIRKISQLFSLSINLTLVFTVRVFNLQLFTRLLLFLLSLWSTLYCLVSEWCCVNKHASPLNC